MKKLMVVALVVAVAVSLGSMGYKAWAIGPGAGTAGQVDVQALKSFQKETLPLRDELMAKGAELRNESTKESPDQNVIAALQKEMSDLRAQIQDAAQKAGLSGQGGWGRGYMMGPGYGPGFMMGGGYGRSYRGGDNDGYGCPRW